VGLHYLSEQVSPITLTIERLWRGQYRLRASVLFLIIGAFAAGVAGDVGAFAFLLLGGPLAGKLTFQLIFWGWVIIAAVGVWRSANSLIDIPTWRGSTKYVGSIKIVTAKLFVCTWIVAVLGAVGVEPEHVLRLFQ